MNENINLCEILKGHEGENFYSPVYGIVKAYIEGDKIKMQGRYNYMMLNSQGFNDNHEDLYDCLECLIFPSKDQRDWNKWAEKQKPKVPKTWSQIRTVRGLCTKILGCKSDIFGAYDGTEKDTPIEKSALALLKIHQLIEVGYGGLVTHSENIGTEMKYTIVPYVDNEFQYKGLKALGTCYLDNRHISFHTKEQAEEFLKYPENVQLLKDYFMI